MRLRSAKFAYALIGLLLISLLAACGSSSSTSSSSSSSSSKQLTIKVGVSPVPHGEILQYVKDNLAAKANLNIQIVTFNDYVQPNTALNEGQLDANYFQHVPYMTDFNKTHGTNIVSVVAVHIEPLGIYSHKIKSLSAVPQNAVVAIPNDATNEGRALQLLADNKLITLKSGVSYSATTNDIASNPKNLQFKELDAAQLPRSLDDTTLSVINGNYALSSGLKPSKDALALESAKNNPYANVLAVNKGHENDPAVKELAKLLTSPQVKKFIEDKYQGSVIPAF